MPRQFGKVDVSASWPPCGSCPHKHGPGSPCPPSATWLVLYFCPACNEPKRLYCRRHRDRHMPALVLGGEHPLGIAPDVRQLAAGEDGAR